MNRTPRTAILLAAGRARRLGALTDDRPKCLLEVGGKTLIEHQIDALRGLGVRDVVVVTGYFADRIEAMLGSSIRSVRNEVYDRTNSLYSLHLALPHVPDGFVLTNADVLFHPGLLGALLSDDAGDALLYEKGDELGDEEMKVRVEEGRVRAMAKTLPAGTYQGENLGVLKFSADGAERVRAAAAELVEAGDVNTWAPKAFDAICREFPIHAVAAGKLPWIEIDFPEDLERARREVWPAISADLSSSRQAHAGG
ncbi:MAG: NTP transferase domain-containing protein [Planctomycetota bacterium JB042]